MPSPALRRLTFVAIGTTLLLLGAAAAVPFRIRAAWQTMQTEAAALRASVEARSTQRPVLWGAGHAGDAFEHYDRACALAHALERGDRDALVQTMLASDEQVATGRRDLRARWQPVLAALRAGAQSADVAPSIPGADGHEPKVANLLDCRWVANVAVFEARALRHEGHGEEAVRRTLDAASLGADLARRGTLIDQMIGCAILSIGTDGAWPEAALAGLDRGALDLLAEGLQRLDADLPLTLDERCELLFTAWHLQHAPQDAAWLPSPASTWRYAFSSRWMLAEAFQLQVERSRRLAATAAAPWPARAAQLDHELATATASGNPLVAVCLPNLGAAEGNWRQQRARVRVLRLAVDLHRGVAPAPLVDPIGGGPITATEVAGGVELTCRPFGDREPARRLVTPR
jgi:hypothetical protein